MYAFTMADGTRVELQPEDESVLDAARQRFGTRSRGETFDFELDLGDRWIHRCSVVRTSIDPDQTCGAAPSAPAIMGWGYIPDQYGRDAPDD